MIIYLYVSLDVLWCFCYLVYCTFLLCIWKYIIYNKRISAVSNPANGPRHCVANFDTRFSRAHPIVIMYTGRVGETTPVIDQGRHFRRVFQERLYVLRWSATYVNFILKHIIFLIFIKLRKLYDVYSRKLIYGAYQTINKISLKHKFKY